MRSIERERNGNAMLGFTLMELLIVIAIIAVLAGLMMPAYSWIKRRGRTVQAKTEVEHLETAWKSYFAEYKRWPKDVEEAREYRIQNGMMGVPLMLILQGHEDARTDNPRKWKFMEFSMLNKSTGDPVNPWADPDSNAPDERDYYYVKFDTDFDNNIRVPDALRGSVEDENLSRSVIVWTEDDKGNIIGSWQ